MNKAAGPTRVASLLVTQEDLNRAQETLYAAFRNNARPKHLDVSPLKSALVRRAIEKVLTQKPLNQLTQNELGVYASSAMTTAGNVSDYRYFLPRILELSSTGSMEHFGLDAWCIADKIRYGKWYSWPTQQQEAVRSFFLAALRYWAIRDPNEKEASDWLVGSALLDQDPEIAFAAFNDTTSAFCEEQFAITVSDLAQSLSELTLGNDHILGDTTVEIRSKIANVLTNPNTMDRLFARLNDPAFENKWRMAAALEAIEGVKIH